MTDLRDRTAVVVGFVGPSGVGKTTLLERLIPALAARGLVVGALKHASHGFLADRPGKDSYRLYESGAGAVALMSRNQVAAFARRDEAAGEVSLWAAVAAVAALQRDLDVVLAEGFSWEPIPRVVLRRGDEQPACQHLEGGEVLEVVSVPTPRPGERPAFPEALVQRLANAVALRVFERAGDARQRPIPGVSADP